MAFPEGRGPWGARAVGTCQAFSQRFALGDLKCESRAASVHRTVSLLDQLLKCRRDLLVEHGTFG